MYESLKTDLTLMASMRANNIEDVKRMKLRESIDKALLKNAEPPIEFMNRLSKDKGLANYVVSQFFDLIMKDLKLDKTKEYDMDDDREMFLAAEE